MKGDFYKQILLVIIGGLIGFGSSIGILRYEKERTNIELYRALFDEISYNLKLDQLIEMSGRNADYEAEVWQHFVASDAYFDMDDDTRKKINSLYSLFKFRNVGHAPMEQRDNKSARNLMETTELEYLVNDYCNYLKKMNIIKNPKIEFSSTDLGFHPQLEPTQNSNDDSCINWHIKNNLQNRPGSGEEG